MNRIGFDIGDEENHSEEQTGFAESRPMDDEDSGGIGRWIYITISDFLVVYGLITLLKNTIDYFRKE